MLKVCSKCLIGILNEQKELDLTVVLFIWICWSSRLKQVNGIKALYPRGSEKGSAKWMGNGIHALVTTRVAVKAKLSFHIQNCHVIEITDDEFEPST
jgi:hypothetical protein